jgi:hypothetical protein
VVANGIGCGGVVAAGLGVTSAGLPFFLQPGASIAATAQIQIANPRVRLS